MRNTAKLITSGDSQAVRLPIHFQFDCDEVYIRKNPETGDVILSKKPDSWDDFFKLVETNEIPQDFMAERDNDISSERDLF